MAPEPDDPDQRAEVLAALRTLVDEHHRRYAGCQAWTAPEVSREVANLVRGRLSAGSGRRLTEGRGWFRLPGRQTDVTAADPLDSVAVGARPTWRDHAACAGHQVRHVDGRHARGRSRTVTLRAPTTTLAESHACNSVPCDA